MKLISITLVLTLGLFTSAVSQPVVLKEVAVSTQTARTPFVGVDGMTVRESSVYLVDRVMHNVAVLNTNDLAFRTEYSRSDIPEASLLTPGFIAVTRNHIFIADFGKNTIRIFSPGFAFIKIIRVRGEIFGIASDADENIWIASVTPGQRQTLKKIDISGTVTEELPLKHATGNPMELYYTFCIDRNNYFYVAYFTKNIIEVLHPSRGFVREFSVPCLPSTVPWTQLKRGLFTKDISLPDGNIFGSITTDNHGRLYILAGEYSEFPLREVEICSTDGKYLSWCVLEEKSHLIHADGKNRLISVEGNKNKVRVYELAKSPHR
jgi:hypothetical protein